MDNSFERIVKKAETIIDKAPPFANDQDKIKMLSLRFRFDGKDGKNILKILKNLK